MQEPHDSPPAPRDRRPDESELAHRGLAFYLDLEPPRSVAAVAQKIGRSYDTAIKWARRHNWYERARQWDNRRLLVETEARERAAAEFAAAAERRRLTAL